ncbi:MAG: cell wall hydrolase [Lachnospiraceae bacterium]|nr:cell wall hydrolase [Lachnospiraceae bacterium]
MNRLKAVLTGSFLSLILSLSLILTPAQGAFADTTSEKLQEAEEQKKQSEAALGYTQSKKDALEDSKDYLEDNLDDLNAKLVQISSSIDEIETKQRKVEEERDRVIEELKDTRERKDAQYAALKARIRTMYEKGGENALTTLAETGSISAFLNRAEYVEKVQHYDQQMLAHFGELEGQEQKKSEELAEKLDEIEKLKEETQEKQGEVSSAIDDTRSSITAYAGAITEAEAEALAIEQKIIEQNSTIAALKDQLKREEELARLSQSMAKRSLSEVTFDGGDRELLGALIQCEAGGEPWEGKIAVGAVVMNRVMSGAFPNTIVGVIYQPGQFEPVSSGRLAIRLSMGANEECLRAADEAMRGTNNIGECLFFRTVVPGIKGTVIGHHVFYLYWTGKYSGYGTADETMEEAKNNPEYAENREGEAPEEAGDDSDEEDDSGGDGDEENHDEDEGDDSDEDSD